MAQLGRTAETLAGPAEVLAGDQQAVVAPLLQQKLQVLLGKQQPLARGWFAGVGLAVEHSLQATN
jgi:hypothetical protein